MAAWHTKRAAQGLGTLEQGYPLAVLENHSKGRMTHKAAPGSQAVRKHNQLSQRIERAALLQDPGAKPVLANTPSASPACHHLSVRETKPGMAPSKRSRGLGLRLRRPGLGRRAQAMLQEPKRVPLREISLHWEVPATP
eukprot:RCo024227